MAMVDPALGVLEYAMKRKSRMPIRYRKWSIKRTRWAWRKFSSPKRHAAPKIYSMEEWQRILASSATGFALGVVLEPIRFWLTAKLNQRKARLALHRCFAQISIDVNWMLDVIATYEEPEVMTRGELWNGLVVVYTQSDLTVCDYYRNSEKTTYYALREARGFNILYSRVGRSLRVLRKIAEDPRAPDALDRVIAEIEDIRKHLDGAAKLRHISTRLMRHYEKKLTATAIEDAVGIFPIVKHKQIQQPQEGE